MSYEFWTPAVAGGGRQVGLPCHARLYLLVLIHPRSCSCRPSSPGLIADKQLDKWFQKLLEALHKLFFEYDRYSPPPPPGPPWALGNLFFSGAMVRLTPSHTAFPTYNHLAAGRLADCFFSPSE